MDVSLTAETGRLTGSRNASRMRAEGLVPGVVYGLGADPVAVTVPWPDLRRALSTEAGLNALIDLEVDGSSSLTVVKDLQRDPVRRSVTHVDFLRIDRDTALAFDVPLVVVGTAPKLEAKKGIIDQVLYTLPIKAKAGSIPNQIEVDVAELELGGSVKVEDLTMPAGVVCEIDPETAVVAGTASRSTILLEQGEGGEEGEGGEGGQGGSEGEGGDAGAGEASEGE